jgi:hypothetical protein
VYVECMWSVCFVWVPILRVNLPCAECSQRILTRNHHHHDRLMPLLYRSIICSPTATSESLILLRPPRGPPNELLLGALLVRLFLPGR